ncbi:MAG: hypothetical protein ACKOYM_03845, partial [Actinomycetes bacterium]
LLPALFILLIAVAVTVAGLLVRRTSVLDDATAGRAGAATTVAPSGLPNPTVRAFDPQGTGTSGENDATTSSALDGNPESAWSTEAYNQRTFTRTKNGVGLALDYGTSARFEQLNIESSGNGWSGTVFVLQPGELDSFDPDRPPAATPSTPLRDISGPLNVGLGDVTGSVVLLWITDLGNPNQSAQFAVEINEIRAIGSAVTAN